VPLRHDRVGELVREQRREKKHSGCGSRSPSQGWTPGRVPLWKQPDPETVNHEEEYDRQADIEANFDLMNLA
jgi:hypothetical protein